MYGFESLVTGLGINCQANRHLSQLTETYCLEGQNKASPIENRSGNFVEKRFVTLGERLEAKIAPLTGFYPIYKFFI